MSSNNSRSSETFRARGNYVVAAFVGAFCGFYLWSAFVQGGLRTIVTTLLVIVVVSSANFVAFIKPSVVFTNEGIDIHNPLSDEFIAWDDVDEIDARWCLTISSGEREIYAYGAPAPGRHRARSVHETEMRGVAGGESGFIRPARSPKSDSGAAVHIALLWQEASKDFTRTRKSVHRRSLTPLYIAIAATFLTIAINIAG